MKKQKILRAWMDPDYRATLSPEELEALPANPAGASCEELSEEELRQMSGMAEDGGGWIDSVTLDCSDSLACQAWSWWACSN